jgi:ubiquinone/menaquinone biosynthesis C-methylase UbiE
MTTTRPDDSWHQGDPYERYVGRWSRRVAEEFVAWLEMPPSLRWLDVGCGTGALTETISQQCQPAELIGVEPSDGFLTKARERLGAKAAFHIGNASAIPLADASVDVVVSGLVLNFVPDVTAAMAEM